MSSRMNKDRSGRAGETETPRRPERPGPAPAQTPMHARDDEAANTEGKDEVQIGSEASFPASDPPSWMNVARPGGRGDTGAAARRDEDRPHIPVEPPRPHTDT
jgi:hypothetical protein